MRASLLAAAVLGLASLAQAQPAPPGTLVVLRQQDADTYDPARSTARSAGEVIYMLADTLTSIDWDMRTVRPGLARSWTVSENGRLYTFALRDDVRFCDGRAMTAEDVVYSLTRFADPATCSPVRWRAGPVEIRATGPRTVEYELTAPFSELPYQLALFFMSIIDRDSVEALGAVMAVNRPAITRAVFFGAGDAADAYLNPAVLDYDPQSRALLPKFDPAAARKLLDDAGWAPGAGSVRAKGGERASFPPYGIQTTEWNRMAKAVQADLRRVGIEMKVQLWDGTVAWGKLATQEFGAFVMSYPYVSAGDALSLYFSSANTPTPNRMNWKDGDTDRWLAEARTAVDPAQRAEALAQVQRQVTEASVWLPLVREQLWAASSSRVQGARAHGIYGVGLYKSLDIRLTR